MAKQAHSKLGAINLAVIRTSNRRAERPQLLGNCVHSAEIVFDPLAPLENGGAATQATTWPIYYSCLGPNK